MVEPEILIRRATKDDYDGVMKISPADLFCGPDYLPDYFYSLLEQPNVVAYVGVIGGKCVGIIVHGLRESCTVHPQSSTSW